MKGFITTAMALVGIATATNSSLDERREAILKAVPYTSTNEVAIVDFKESEIKFADFTKILASYSMED